MHLVRYHVAVSLDGFIAPPDGSAAWLEPYGKVAMGFIGPWMQQIGGIVSLESQHVTRRLGQSFCRGVQTTITFDEDKYVGSGLFLFACVLERFLGQYVSVNSFSQLVAKTIQRKEVLKQWPPRNGNQILL